MSYVEDVATLKIAEDDTDADINELDAKEIAADFVVDEFEYTYRCAT